MTNINKLVPKLNILKGRKRKGRTIIGRKSSAIRKSSRVKKKKRITSLE
jgi:hypothetical protein